MYKNSEGYHDPTAGRALSAMMREYKNEQRKKYRMKNWPKVYVASRLAGDVKKNMNDAARCCRFVADRKRIPVASHLMYPSMGFDDDNPAEREMCCMFGLSLLAVCDEVWCFTVDGVISAGMESEIAEAKKLKIPVRYFDIETEVV